MLQAFARQKLIKTSILKTNISIKKNYFQRMFNPKKQIGELIETYLAKKSETSDNEILKNVLHEYHAAHISCANSQLSLETMQHA